MKKSILIITFILVAVIFTLIGAVSVYIITRPTPQQAQLEKNVNLILSKTISSITSSGKVTAIEGRNITISNLGDSVTILVPAGKPVYSLESEDGVQKKITFEDIKIGDSVNIGLKVKDNKQLEGQSIIIFATEPAQ